MIDFSTYKFRCSSLGDIIAPSGKLTQGIKSELKRIHTETVYEITKDITSKYFEKGIINESDGLDILNKYLYPELFLNKNEKYYNNEYICGTPDVIVNNKIIYDIKNAWDIFTFRDASLSHQYTWQLKGYCFLTNLEKSGLFYVLTDMPENLMIKEETSLYYKGKFNDVADPKYIEAVRLLREKHDYSKLDIEERFRVWYQYYTKEDEETIINSVMVAREYLMNLEKERIEELLSNKKLIKV